MSIWRTVPLRAIYQRVELRGRADLPLLSVYRDHGVVPRDERDDNNNRPSEDLSTYKYVRPGDLVVNKMKTWQGSLAVSGHEGIVSPAYFVGRRVAEVDDRFMHHLLRSIPLIAEYGARSKGIRPSQWDLPWDEFAAIKVALPEAQEQRAIADFLDSETAHIDALVDRKQKLIGLLDDRRRNAYVSDWQFALRESQAAPLWTVVKEVKSPNRNGMEDNRLSLSHGHVIPRSIDSAEGLLPESYDSYNIIERLDVVLRLTDLQNDQRSLRVGVASERGIITSAYVALRCTSSLSGDFVGLMLKGMDAARVFYALGAGVRQSLKFDELKKLNMPLPTLEVQKDLVRRASLRDAATARTSELLRRQIELLREHRQALITAAVTGQIEVPGVAA